MYTDASSLLKLIEEREPRVKAWAFHDPKRVKAQIATKEAQGRLAGLAIGIKDIFDTEDMTTTYGSAAYATNRPVRDCWVVQRLRTEGAIIMGKTVSTEFAYLQAGPTRNPHNPDHTPGGSSSGSAAAVGAGMVPVAIGSQTGGSTIRPSAYCGVVGFKPTYGTISLQGVMPLSPSLDTVGIHAIDLDLVERVLDALLIRQESSKSPPAKPRIAYYPGPHTAQAQPAAIALLEDIRARIETSGFASIKSLAFSESHYQALCDANRVIMHYEAARMHHSIYESDSDRLGAHTISLIESGLRTPVADYQQALKHVTHAYQEFMVSMRDIDVVLTFSSPGEAPRFYEGTGSSVFNQAWTTLGVPCVTLPAGTGPHGLPLGIQLVAKPHQDLQLLQIARQMQQSCKLSL